MALAKESAQRKKKKAPPTQGRKKSKKKLNAKASKNKKTTKKNSSGKKKSQKKSTRKTKSDSAQILSARGIWNGHISFGLINIPVRLVSSREQPDLHFTMLDPRNLSPVGYKYYNKASGKEISRSDTVKAYEFEKDQYVIMTEADFKKANPEATQSIDIENFVNIEEIDPVFFQRAYYVLPNKGGDKAYTLLCQALHDSNRVAIAKVVLHTKQHLTALIPRGDFLILELLHFAEDVKDLSELEDTPGQNLKVLPQEVDMAMSLIETMASDWKPEKYKDTYREDLMKRVEAKIKAGKSTEITVEPRQSRERPSAGAADLLPLLQQSLAQKKKSSTRKSRTLH